jgi:arginyl-tRNA synthetase
MPTSVYAKYRLAFAEAIGKAVGSSAAEIEPQIKPADPQHGDLSFAAFPLAKTLRKAPAAIATAAAQLASVPGMEVRAAGPYVNARFLPMPFSEEVITEVRGLGGGYGSSAVGAGKTVVIDYSSPNIAKPIAFHHIRSTMIGHCLANLYRSQGYPVEGINYLGDWGKQFGLVAVGFQEFGDPSRQRDMSHDMAHLVDVYVKANARAEQDPQFDQKARDFFRRMELKEPEAIRLWRELRDISIQNFQRIYARLGIRFEHYEGESLYQDKMEAVIDEIARTVGVRESEGALIVDMPYPENEPPVLLKKKDGTTLYATRDLAAAVDRYERFHFDRSLYVVATDQSLHFRQLFAVLERMGKPWAKACFHIGFGRVHGMSTRRGTVVLLDDVLDEAKSRALEKVLENQKTGKIQAGDPDPLAEQIGVGAIVFGDLKNRRLTDYTFDWEDALNFDGHTGPYLQYAHARTCNVLLKGGGSPAAYDASQLRLPEEQALIRAVAQYPLAIEEALQHNEPSSIARYLLELAACYSRWYTLGNQDRSKRILVEDNSAVRNARLALNEAVEITLRAGLSLLGIPTPERM